MNVSKKKIMEERVKNAYEYGDLNGKLLGSILEVLLVLVDQKEEKPLVERLKKKQIWNQDL